MDCAQCPGTHRLPGQAAPREPFTFLGGFYVLLTDTEKIWVSLAFFKSKLWIILNQFYKVKGFNKGKNCFLER